MKAYLTCWCPTWDVDPPYYEWADELGNRKIGEELPKTNPFTNARLLSTGTATLKMEIEFTISGNPTGKQEILVAAIAEMLKEIEV